MSSGREIVAALIAGGIDPIEAATMLARAVVEMTPSIKAPTSGANRMSEYRDRREAMGLPRIFPSDKYRPQLLARDGDRCIYCESQDALVIDHIHPTFLGGDDDLGNLGLACRPCNGRKAGRPLADHGMKIAVKTAAGAHEDYKSRTQFTPRTPEHSSHEPRTTAHNRAQVHPSQNASLSIEERKKEKKEKRESTRASQLPADWLPAEHVWQATVDLVGLERCNTELTKFRNHAADKGRVSKDWNAAWRNWIDRAIDYGAKNGQSLSGIRTHQASGSPPTRDAAVIASLGRTLERRRAARAADRSGDEELFGDAGAAGEPTSDASTASGDDEPHGKLALMVAADARG